MIDVGWLEKEATSPVLHSIYKPNSHREMSEEDIYESIYEKQISINRISSYGILCITSSNCQYHSEETNIYEIFTAVSYLIL